MLVQMLCSCFLGYKNSRGPEVDKEKNVLIVEDKVIGWLIEKSLLS